MRDLFGRCLCVPCRALEVTVRVIDEGHPTNIDLFCEYICTTIVNSHDGERSTRREAVRQIMRFRKWCKLNGITDITMVRQEEIEAFVHWPVMMGGRARRPGWSTMRNRRTYMRRAYKTARDLGYEMIDPTIDVEVVFHRTVEANLCTDDDIERLRDGTPVQ